METLYVWIDDLNDPTGAGIWFAEVESEAAAAAILAKLPAGIGGEYYGADEFEVPPVVADAYVIEKFFASRTEFTGLEGE
jgi:hypothetical protein